MGTNYCDGVRPFRNIHTIGAFHTGILEGIMKTLILYSSHDGQTKKIAEFMAQYLEEEVVVSPLTEEPDLLFFDRVIIGASIRYGHFNKQLLPFCGTPS